MRGRIRHCNYVQYEYTTVSLVLVVICFKNDVSNGLTIATTL